ncbi:MAG: hypothetical protein AAF719_06920 [Pseudomonadota bacterium]
MKSSLATLAALGIFGFSASPALANDTDISGSWIFETGGYSNQCAMHGRMTIEPDNGEGVHACYFTVYETCANHRAEVEQVCSAKRTGTQVTIESTITKFAKMEPYEYGYAPDNWALAIKQGGEMFGSLVSAHNTWARFTRQDAPIS